MNQTQPTREDCIRLAAFIDGEGCIEITATRGEMCRKMTLLNADKNAARVISSRVYVITPIVGQAQVLAPTSPDF